MTGIDGEAGERYAMDFEYRYAGESPIVAPAIPAVSRRDVTLWLLAGLAESMPGNFEVDVCEWDDAPGAFERRELCWLIAIERYGETVLRFPYAAAEDRAEGLVARAGSQFARRFALGRPAIPSVLYEYADPVRAHLVGSPLEERIDLGQR